LYAKSCFFSVREGTTSTFGHRPLIDLNSDGFALVSGQKGTNNVYDSYLLSMNASGQTGCEIDTSFTRTTYNLARYSLPDTLSNLTATDTTILHYSTNPTYDSICPLTLKSAKNAWKNLDSYKVKSGINIYPNPTNGKIQIELNGMEDGIFDITIFDLLGKIMYQNNFSKIGNMSFSYDFSGYNRGVYLIRINSENNNYTTKVIVE